MLNNNIEEAKERLNKFKTIEILYGNTFAMNLQQLSQLQEDIETVLQELEKGKNKTLLYKQQYEKILNDFKNYKNDKDINYLDGIHHKKLVEKAIGQIIDKPEECWFDKTEVIIIIHDEMYNAETEEDFITLQQISAKNPEACMVVIAESPLSGTIYRYNNYGNKEWQLIGTMLGYA